MAAIRFMDAARDFHVKAEIPARDLLPLIPPGADLGEKSNVKPHQLGKIPGRFAYGKWYGLTGPWPTFGLSESDRQAAELWPTHNVGLRAADFPGVDCDVNTPEALALVEDLINRRLGDRAPVRTRGATSRALFVFRRGGDDPVRKIRVDFEDSNGTAHAVEVLGLGQQYVVAGMHPEGMAYEWREGRDLVRTKASELPVVTAAKLSAFMADLCREIELRGWKVTKTHSPRYGQGAEGQGVLLANAEPLVDAELALKALRAVPNDEKTLPNREDLIAVCASFKHMLGRDADQYYEEFVHWACRFDWATREYVKPIWDSLTAVRTSPDYLFSLARKHGFRGDAVVDFADYGDDVDRRIEVLTGTETEEEHTLRTLAERLIYFPSEELFIVKASGEMLTASAFNKYPGLGTALAPAGATGVKTAANILINSGLLTTVASITYEPGQPQIVTQWREGREVACYNRWYPRHHTLPESVTDADVKPWLDHVAYLVPDEVERNTLLDYLAHIIQRRGVKIRWAPLLVGRQGTGKDMMIKPVVHFFAHNAREIKPEQLMEKFNSFLENELIVVEEMVRFDKAEVYDRIKPMISGTATERLTVERKHKEAYEVPNRVNFFFFSNNPDAVKLDDDDRRFFVVSSEAEKQSQDYYENLAEGFYKHQSGWRKVVRWLMQRDCSQLDINRPLDTEAKQMMIEVQRSPFYVTLREQLDEGFYKNRTVLTAHEVMMTAKNDFNFPLDSRTRGSIRNVNEITKALRNAGWRPYEKLVKGKGNTGIRFWVRTPALLNKAPHELRAQYEKETKS